LRRRYRSWSWSTRHYIPVSADFAQAIALGLGWGMLPPQQSAILEAAGRLAEIDPGVRIDVPLYWQQWKLHSPMLARLADAIATVAAEALRT
jgi:LysR family transcriptional regulator (chromosome initiation inhibitor)